MKYFALAKDKVGNIGYSVNETSKKDILNWISRMKSAHGVTRIEVYKDNKNGFVMYETCMIWKEDINKLS